MKSLFRFVREEDESRKWSALYSILRKELPRYRGDYKGLSDLVRSYADRYGVKLKDENQVKKLIDKFALKDFNR